MSCQDGSGYIDENELDALLKDLYEKNKKVGDWAQRLREMRGASEGGGEGNASE